MGFGGAPNGQVSFAYFLPILFLPGRERRGGGANLGKGGVGEGFHYCWGWNKKGREGWRMKENSPPCSLVTSGGNENFFPPSNPTHPLTNTSLHPLTSFSTHRDMRKGKICETVRRRKEGGNGCQEVGRGKSSQSKC